MNRNINSPPPASAAALSLPEPCSPAADSRAAIADSRATGEMPAVALPPFYVTGGSLPEDACSYVERQADRDLLTALRAGQFCYVLDSRQVGKSSLMVRAAAKLRAENWRVAVLDLSACGQNVSPEQWYFGMLFAIGDQLHIEDELEAFWGKHAGLGLVQRWIEAVGQVALAQSSEPLVIFIDEIDAVKSLPFSADEFFAAIRECYNRRTRDSAFTRLSFCLIGVATPSELIQNPHTTPFNIGQRIALLDFSEAEAAPLAVGLSAGSGHGAALLGRVLQWTGGHPYLTQILCRYLAEQNSLHTIKDVDQACHTLFLTRQARETNDNLTFVRKRLLGDCVSDAQIAEMLHCYRRVLRGRGKILNDPTDPLVTTLLLCGLARAVTYEPESALRVRNRIYARVFNEQWVLDTLPDAERRRLRAAIRRDVARASISWLTAALALAIASWQFAVARNAAQQAAQSRDQVQQNRVAMEEQRAKIAGYQQNIMSLRQQKNETQKVAEMVGIARQQAERRREQVERDSKRVKTDADKSIREAITATRAANAREQAATRRASLAETRADKARQVQQQLLPEAGDAMLAGELTTHPGHEIDGLRLAARTIETVEKAASRAGPVRRSSARGRGGGGQISPDAPDAGGRGDYRPLFARRRPDSHGGNGSLRLPVGRAYRQTAAKNRGPTHS